MLPFQHTWLPFIYLYGLGGILFLLGIIITRRAGALDLSKPKHRMWMVILIFGFFWYFSIHGLLNLAALDIIHPRTGESSRPQASPEKDPFAGSPEPDNVPQDDDIPF